MPEQQMMPDTFYLLLQIVVVKDWLGRWVSLLESYSRESSSRYLRVLGYPEALESSRSAARLLCGLNSPYLTRGKLSKNQLFGQYADIPFGSVMDQVSQAIKFV